MIRPWMIGIMASAAAWAIVRRSTRVVPAAVAAEMLRRAWADHHTTA